MLSDSRSAAVVISSGVLLSFLIACGGSNDGNVQTGPTRTDSTTATVGSGGGVVVTPNGDAGVQIPAGALARTSRLPSPSFLRPAHPARVHCRRHSTSTHRSTRFRLIRQTLRSMIRFALECARSPILPVHCIRLKRLTSDCSSRTQLGLQPKFWSPLVSRIS